MGARYLGAGYYAGYVASAFTFGRFLSGYVWGYFTDYFGRKPVIISVLFCMAAFSVGFGFSTSYSWALWWRCEHTLLSSAFALVTNKVLSMMGCDVAYLLRNQDPDNSRKDREINVRHCTAVQSTNQQLHVAHPSPWPPTYSLVPGGWWCARPHLYISLYLFRLHSLYVFLFTLCCALFCFHLA